MDKPDRPRAQPRHHQRRRHRHKEPGYNSSSEGDNMSGYQSDGHMDSPKKMNGLGKIIKGLIGSSVFFALK